MRGTLSLCIPAYNAAWCLPQLLHSARDQSIPFDEILIYDDCGFDDIGEIAMEYGATLVKGDQNRGCSFGKNKLAAISTSDWLHFHDADDLLLPNFTSEVHGWIARSGDKIDVLLLNFEYIEFADKKFLGTASHDQVLLQEDPLRYVISNKTVNFGVYKKSSFLRAGGFDLDPDVLYNEDKALHISLAKKGLHFDYLEEITCINYRHQGSMSVSNDLKCAKSNYHVLKKIASTHGQIYAKEITEQLWKAVTILASLEAWDYVKKSLNLIKGLGSLGVQTGNRYFDLLARINPLTAVWLREKMLRILQPALRKRDVTKQGSSK